MKEEGGGGGGGGDDVVHVDVLASLRLVGEILGLSKRGSAAAAKMACGVLLGLEYEHGASVEKKEKKKKEEEEEESEERLFKRNIHATALQIAHGETRTSVMDHDANATTTSPSTYGVENLFEQSREESGSARAARFVAAAERLAERREVSLYATTTTSTSWKHSDGKEINRAEVTMQATPVRFTRHREVLTMLISLSRLLTHGDESCSGTHRRHGRRSRVDENHRQRIGDDGIMYNASTPFLFAEAAAILGADTDGFDASVRLPFGDPSGGVHSTDTATGAGHEWVMSPVSGGQHNAFDWMYVPASDVSEGDSDSLGEDDVYGDVDPEPDLSSWVNIGNASAAASRKGVPGDAYTWSGRRSCVGRSAFLVDDNRGQWPQTFAVHLLSLLQGSSTDFSSSSLALEKSQLAVLAEVRETMRIRRRVEQALSHYGSSSHGHVAQGLGIAMQSVLRAHDACVHRLSQKYANGNDTRMADDRGSSAAKSRMPSPIHLLLLSRELRSQLRILHEIPFKASWSPQECSTNFLDYLYEKLSDDIAEDDGTSALLRFLFTAACRPFARNVYQWIYEGTADNTSLAFVLCEETESTRASSAMHVPKFFRRNSCLHQLLWCGRQLRILTQIPATRDAILRVARRSVMRTGAIVGEESMRTAVGGTPASEGTPMSTSAKLLECMFGTEALETGSTADVRGPHQKLQEEDALTSRHITFDLHALRETADLLMSIAEENNAEVDQLMRCIETDHADRLEQARASRQRKRDESAKMRAALDEAVVSAMADEVQASARKVARIKSRIVRTRWKRAIESVIFQLRNPRKTMAGGKFVDDSGWNSGAEDGLSMKSGSINDHGDRESAAPSTPGAPSSSSLSSSDVVSSGAKREIVFDEIAEGNEISTQSNQEDQGTHECSARSSRHAWPMVSDPFPAAGKRSDSVPRLTLTSSASTSPAGHGAATTDNASPSPPVVEGDTAAFKSNEAGDSAPNPKTNSSSDVLAIVSEASSPSENDDESCSQSRAPVSVVVDTCIHAAIRQQYLLTSRALLSVLHGPTFNMQGQFEALKNYFCLGIANFGDSLLSEIVSHLPALHHSRSASTAVARGGANGILDKLLDNALKDACCDTDSFSTKLSLYWRSASSSGAAGSMAKDGGGAASRNSLDIWDSIRLGCTLEWPMTLVFNKAALTRYARIFQYLMKLRHVNSLLIAAWTNVSREASKGAHHGKEHRRRLWKLQLLRAEASQFVSVLQQHASTEILGDARVCESLMYKANDIGELGSAHQYHVEVVSRRGCLLGKEQHRLKSIIDEALHALVTVLEHLQLHGIDDVCVDDSKWSVLLETEAFFLRRLKFLGRVLKNVADHGQMGGGGRAMMGLYLKLDYNGYFSCKFGI